jgi:thiamine biosynthesis lipoprotein
VSPAERLVLIPDPVLPPWQQEEPLEPLRWEGRTMGTIWRVSAYASGAVARRREAIFSQIQRRLDSIVKQMSHYEAESDLSRYNRAEAGTWVTLPEDLYRVLRCGLEIASASHGWFDPTLGQVISLWGFGPEAEDCDPQLWEGLEALKRCGWEKIQLCHSRRQAWQPGGVDLNLSAIAKGFAVDEIAVLLRARGVAAGLVEIGGEFAGWGVKPNGSPWWVELENPPYGEGAIPEAVVALCGQAVASSGDWVQRRRAGRKSVSHLIDPCTGAPVEGPVTGAAVVHESCMIADAWATALCVAPLRAAMRLAECHGLAARLVYRKPCGRMEQWLSPAMQAMLD